MDKGRKYPVYSLSFLHHFNFYWSDCDPNSDRVWYMGADPLDFNREELTTMDNLQEVEEKLHLAQTLLIDRITFLNDKSRTMYHVGFVSLGQDLDAVSRELNFVINELGKVLHLIITHNIKN